MPTPALSPDEFVQWSSYIQQISGIQLTPDKTYLIQTRFAPLLQELCIASFRELLLRATGDASGGVRRKVINAITTNETSFFRDTAPFDLLRHKLIPELIDSRRASGQQRLSLRIWSAACSTGQEAYSIAIVLRDLLGDLTRHDIRILGTDLSEQAVATASYAHYTQHELSRGMSPADLQRHFVPVDARWKVRDELRALVSFRVMNLLDPVGLPSPFDIIYCRNVAIYFNPADRQRLYAGVRRALSPRGALIIGATESLAGFCPDLVPQRYLRTVFYRPK